MDYELMYDQDPELEAVVVETGWSYEVEVLPYDLQENERIVFKGTLDECNEVAEDYSTGKKKPR